ncbi:MAG: hypothetical protein ABH872_00910 [Candidatus Omnitrophota bacterium]
MGKINTIIQMALFLFICIQILGCREKPPLSSKNSEGLVMGDEIIKTDLNGLSDKQIRIYFSECVKSGSLFLYTGGYANSLLLKDEQLEYDFLNKIKTYSLGCDGGVEEGYKFNKLMVDYIIQNEENLKF